MLGAGARHGQNHDAHQHSAPGNKTSDAQMAQELGTSAVNVPPPHIPKACPSQDRKAHHIIELPLRSWRGSREHFGRSGQFVPKTDKARYMGGTVGNQFSNPTTAWASGATHEARRSKTGRTRKSTSSMPPRREHMNAAPHREGRASGILCAPSLRDRRQVPCALEGKRRTRTREPGRCRPKAPSRFGGGGQQCS